MLLLLPVFPFPAFPQSPWARLSLASLAQGVLTGLSGNQGPSTSLSLTAARHEHSEASILGAGAVAAHVGANLGAVAVAEPNNDTAAPGVYRAIHALAARPAVPPASTPVSFPDRAEECRNLRLDFG